MLNTPIDQVLISNNNTMLTQPLSADELAQFEPLCAALTHHFNARGVLIIGHNKVLWNLLYQSGQLSLNAVQLDMLLPHLRETPQWTTSAEAIHSALPAGNLAAVTHISPHLRCRFSLCVLLGAYGDNAEPDYPQIENYLQTVDILLAHIHRQRLIATQLTTKQRLRFVLEATQAGIWEWEVGTDNLLLNERWAEILGYSLDELAPVSLNTWFALVHPEDREKSDTLIRQCFNRESDFYDCECRMRHKNGEWVWIHDRGKVTTWSAQGKPLYMAGTQTDINDKKQTELALSHHAEFQKLVFDHLPVYLFVKDTQYRIVAANTAFLSLYPPEQRDQVIGTTTLENYDKDEANAFLKQDILAFAVGSTENEEQIHFPNGDIRILWTKKIRFEDSDGDAFILGVSADITELKNSEYAMRLAKNEAEAANQAKSEFLATMSHEIRTPINGIMGMLELALQNTSDALQQRRLKLASSSAKSLLTIINDILDFSKIEAQKLELDYAPFNIDELINRIVHEQTAMLQNKPVELLVDLSQLKFNHVVGDEVRVGQILTNLLTNAIKFTQQGFVCLRVRGLPLESQGLMLEFEIEDTGIGISDVQQQTLFTPFTQADSSTTRRFGGTGLGLSICQRIAMLMNGKVKVKSEPGKGSTFTATVTLESPAQMMPPPKVDGIIIVAPRSRQLALLCKQLSAWHIRYVSITQLDELADFLNTQSMPLDWLMIDESMLLPFSHLLNDDHFSALTQKLPEHQIIFGCAQPLAGQHALEFSQRYTMLGKPLLRGDLYHLFKTAPEIKHRDSPPPATPLLIKAGPVLVVEDNPINLEVTSHLLAAAGYHILTAENGEEALEVLNANEDIALVLMDCRMPVMDGFTATYAIRSGKAGEDYRAIPIVACTANASVKDKQDCLQAGMNAYLSKPLDRQALLSTLASLLTADYSI